MHPDLVGLTHVTLAAACDLDETTLAAFGDRWRSDWPELNLYTDHRKMLEREELDIVTVATSDHRHAVLVVDAADAGAKGIFCEKPLATNLADADRMVRRRRTQRRDSVRRSHEAVSTAVAPHQGTDRG